MKAKLNKRKNLFTYLYLASTLPLCVIIMYISSKYLIWPETTAQKFAELQFPDYLIVPTALIQILGAVVLMYPRYRSLTEFVYAGFLFKFALVLFSQIEIHVSDWMYSSISIILWGISFTSYKVLMKLRSRIKSLDDQEGEDDYED